MGTQASGAGLEELFCRLRRLGGGSRSFLGHPKLPKYLDKQGRNLLTYTEQAISRAPKNRGYVVPSGLDIRVETRQTAIDQVRIVPHATHYTVEVIYERPVTPADVDPARSSGD